MGQLQEGLSLSLCNSHVELPTIDDINGPLKEGSTPCGLRDSGQRFVYWALQSRKGCHIAKIKWPWGMIKS